MVFSHESSPVAVEPKISRFPHPMAKASSKTQNVKCLKGNLGLIALASFIHIFIIIPGRKFYSLLGLIQFLLHFCTGNRYLDIEVLSSKENVTVTLNGQLV